MELLCDLVAIPSVSGQEADIAVFIESTAKRWGLNVARDSNGVRIEVTGWGVGPTLVLASHLDVVPPGSGWTRDPFVPVIEGNRLYGRGSGDAKASVAAMLYAAKDLVDSGGMDAGRLLLLFGLGEETENTTMEAALEGERNRCRSHWRAHRSRLCDCPARADDGRAAEPGRSASRRLCIPER
ncbi:MAG TPA: M20/M25/M40 family metallo-hydrolase [Gemmatimonadales bacterium]|nr:M20/M25/M40 family metallo-hydrolase [Gemmatimonadales bacterium]